MNRLQKQVAKIHMEKKRLEKKLTRDSVSVLEHLMTQIETLCVKIDKDDVETFLNQVKSVVQEAKERQMQKMQKLQMTTGRDDSSIFGLPCTPSLTKETLSQDIAEMYHNNHRGTL